MSPRRIAHVFPYDPRHLRQTFDAWVDGQLTRWPLAAVAASRLAERSTVHVIGPRARRREARLAVVEHPAVASGPRFRDWGDDWSLSLERALRRLGREDVCVIHLNDYPAARLAQRAASGARVVLVLHGRGVGRPGDDLAHADLVVALRRDASDELRTLGVDDRRLAVVTPSVDRATFAPPAARPRGTTLGYVGRLEEAKGVLELPGVLRRLPDADLELVGPHTATQRALVEAAAREAGVADRIAVLGELPAAALAERMRGWRALVLPSYTEGYGLVALEALVAGTPVAAVSGVLPRELEGRPGLFVRARDSLHEAVLAAIDAPLQPDAGWVPDHDDGGRTWDELLSELPDWRPRPRVAASRIARVRRLRPLRRAARRALRRNTV